MSTERLERYLEAALALTDAIRRGDKAEKEFTRACELYAGLSDEEVAELRKRTREKRG